LQVTGARTYDGLAGNIGEKNVVLDGFVYVIGETQLIQVLRHLPWLLTRSTKMPPAEDA
jgi:hypothetical protein